MRARKEVADAGSLSGFATWFYAAAAYNFVWGLLNIVFPRFLFTVLGIEKPNYLPVWQVVGMFVLVYTPAYIWAARYPDRYPHFILIGMLGKILGPLGFVWAVAQSDFPAIFGLTILTNDLIWWPAFTAYLSRAARARGGWRSFLQGN